MVRMSVELHVISNGRLVGYLRGPVHGGDFRIFNTVVSRPRMLVSISPVEYHFVESLEPEQVREPFFSIFIESVFKFSV